VFARDGTLFVTLGERSIPEGRMQAHRLDGTLGKIVRIKPDGSIPQDNPFVNRAGARPEIWSIGHRNVQAAVLHPTTGELWEVEHGTRGGDEVNIPSKGKDYGWPTASLFPTWRGSLFIGGLASQSLVRLSLDGERVTGEERLLANIGERIRDVQQGLDDALYLLTDSSNGRILKLVPK
jgi:aldose sugar dehydrogenase